MDQIHKYQIIEDYRDIHKQNKIIKNAKDFTITNLL